jgi:ribosome-binding protein aMBF1 (putative translation factor)
MSKQKRPEPRGGKKKTRDAGAILDRVIGSDRELRRKVESERLGLRVAQMLYDARTAAGLTQGQLAKLVGTTQSVISRLEDADYEGHSLSMLQRVAKALHRQIDIRFVPDVA